MNLVTELRGLADEHHEMLGDIHIPLNRAADCIEDLVAALQTALHAIDNLTNKDGAMTLGLAALSKANAQHTPKPSAEVIPFNEPADCPCDTEDSAA